MGGKIVPILVSGIFLIGVGYRLLFEFKAGKNLTYNIESKEVFDTNLAFSSNDTWSYILPAYQIYKQGSPYFEVGDLKVLFCRRNPTSYLIFVPFWIFDKYMPVIFVVFVSLLFAVSLYFLFSILVRLGCNNIFCLLSGMIYIFYWIENVPKLLTEGVVASGVALALGFYLKDSKKYLNVVFGIAFILSMVRGEFFFILLFIWILILYKKFKENSKITLGFMFLMVIMLGGWNWYWNRLCGNTSGIWYWSRRSLLNIKYNVSLAKAKEVIMKEHDRVVSELIGGRNLGEYETYVIRHSYPFYKIIVENDKKNVLESIDVGVIKYIFYRILLRNPYLFVFSRPSGDFLERSGMNKLLQDIYII